MVTARRGGFNENRSGRGDSAEAGGRPGRPAGPRRGTGPARGAYQCDAMSRESAGVLNRFHPAVRRWFSEQFEAPTAPQRGAWRAIAGGRHTLVSAPTGSGKTLAAFLGALDSLFREGARRPRSGGGEGGLPDETRVVYVSPLKALSADIHRNLQEPRRGIRRAAEEMGLPPVSITAGVRTGDTPRSERRRMVETPPHVLVTTPESLYLYLTARRSRETLRSARTVIVDEIHDVLESRRGAHLSLTLERLEHVAEGDLQRVGLSATQNPIGEVARFLVGGGHLDADGEPDCAVVDEGHEQEMDLALELPESPLESVLSGEAREEIVERLAELVASHRTTLVFVNTRREAERVARDLSELVGEDEVTAHHGSLSKETRHRSEERLKEGALSALVATASMELGIDIGYVDLVCQLGSPHRVSSLLQRVGRSGHTVAGTPRGRLFPMTRDDLVECAALRWCVRRGDLDRVEVMEAPLDILSQQVVAEAACEDWETDALFALYRRAYPYGELERDDFDDVVRMASRGFSTGRGRRGARIHHDPVNGVIRGRRGSRMMALTSGGAIPDNADYRVLKEPEGTYVGTVNEDFAIESMPGDIVQLGNTSWRILRVESGVVRVEDARGEPPNIPFWLGEAPARSRTLSAAVSEIRREVDERLGPVGSVSAAGTSEDGDAGTPEDGDGPDREAAVEWLESEPGLRRPAAFQVAEYLAQSKRILGTLPDDGTLVLERFFDESGGMQLVVHSPFGSRVNRAWGLALRKRFCRQFNFELQAAATEEGILLSLGPRHSFPLEDVFRYLEPGSVRPVLVQALLDAPVFQTRWRWNATLSLALLRWRDGSKVAPQIQRMQAEDLLSAVFPDANACLENIAGEREIPYGHPLVRQTVDDCLTDAMDLPGLERVLESIHGGAFDLVARDTPEPSPLSHEIVNARPFAFLDDDELEERRVQAVYTRRAMEPSAAKELGALDPDAIRRVRDQAWPEPENADELHDALLTAGYLRADEVRAGRPVADWSAWMDELASGGRAARALLPAAGGNGGEGGDGRAGLSLALWVAAERLPELREARPEVRFEPELEPPEGHARRPEDREEALRSLLGDRAAVLGPTTAAELGRDLGIGPERAGRVLLALESEGSVLRGHFTPGADAGEGGDGGDAGGGDFPGADGDGREWCERGLLARIHRYTLEELRERIRPVSAADFTRFLFRWQRVQPGHRVQGAEGLAAVIELLQGVEVPAAAWETEVLAARCEGYDPAELDRLCASGRVAWGRLSPPDGGGEGLRRSGPLRSSPVSLWPREATGLWLGARPTPEPDDAELSTYAREVLGALRERGASFFPGLVEASGLLPTQVEQALGELVAFGFVTADGFAGLRALLLPSDKRRALGGSGGGKRGRTTPYGVDTAGRWSMLRRGPGPRRETRRDEAGAAGDGSGPNSSTSGPAGDRDAVRAHARALLRRYGIVFRRLLDREEHAPAWRDLVLAFRRMEARGEVRGGRFVSGFSGEQFALPEAVGAVRDVRGDGGGELVVIGAADPLNLTGVVTPGDRIPALATNRVAYRGGVPVAALEGGEIRRLEGRGGVEPEVERRLVRREVPPVLREYVARSG